jgi:glyoxylase-like metal-dependent hydrolase (beta-lactamase superfamily II)
MHAVTVRAVVTSRFALDGGAMHGIVPRALWQRVHTPDPENRVALVARVAIVDCAASGTRALIDLGMGQRWSDKERALYALDDGPDVPDALASAGVDPDTVTHVVLTHLHWDHAGGVVRRDGAIAFPRAEHVVGEASLARARSPSEKDAGSFRAADLDALAAHARLRTWRPGEPLAPGLEGTLSNGHTPGLVIPIAHRRDDGPPLAFPTDLVPTRSHLAMRWVMAYDEQPSVTVAEKRALAVALAASGGGVCLYHDPLIEAAWARDGARGLELVPGALTGTA